MKKIFRFIIIILFTLVTFSFGSTSFASLKEDSVINNTEKSIEESYQDAINGISDLPVSKFNINNDLSITTESGYGDKDSINIIKSSTAQILKETVKDGETEQLVAVTVFNDVDFNDEDEIIYNPFASHDKGGEESDSSYGVKAYNRFYYTTTVERGITHAKLNKVTGSWTISDNTISLSSRIVRFGASGWPIGSQSAVKYPTGNSYTYNAPSSWEKVALTGSYSFGTNSTVTLKKGTSSWTLKLSNNL